MTQIPFQNCTGLQEFIRARGSEESDAVESNANYVPLPSCRVFAEYCASQLRQQERFSRLRMIGDTVIDISYIPPTPGDDSKVGTLRVTLSSGEKNIIAKQVVYAAKWSTPVVPSWMVEARLLSRREEAKEDERGRGDKTTLATLAEVDVRTAEVEGHSVVVVGGGMGACTLAHAALLRGANSVTLMSRGLIRCREQECDVAYFGNKGLRKFRLLSEPSKRLEMLREARQHATINDLMWKQIQQSEKSDVEGDGLPKMRIMEHCEVERVERCQAGNWCVMFSSSLPTEEVRHDSGGADIVSSSPVRSNPLQHEEMFSSAITADFVWAACGEIVDASRDPALQSLLHESGSIVGGFPVLVEDGDRINEPLTPGSVRVRASAAAAGNVGSLRWPGVPLYFVGPYTSLSVGPAASLPAGHRLAARAVASAMQVHANESRRGINPYAMGLSEAQQCKRIPHDTETVIPRVLRLVPKSERHRALMDVRELNISIDGIDIPRIEISRYEVIDEGFLIQVRISLPEAVPSECVRVAFADQSVELWAAGEKAAYRFFVSRLYKPIIVERCTFKVSQRHNRVTVILHKFDNLSWRFLKG